jgi:sigma-B regulation protein RsbU (phosphoserine phosphatase)
MRFRWKLLILLLLISIGPIVLMRTIGMGSVRQFRDTLVDQIRENRIASEQERLLLIADAHALVLWEARSQVEAALLALAAHAEQLLAKPPASGFEVSFAGDFGPAAQQPGDALASSRHFRQRTSGRIEFLPVAYSEPVFQIPPVVDPGAVTDDIARLSGMRETFRRLSRLLEDSAIWQNIGLANGVFCEYPGHGSLPAAFDARRQRWYQQAAENRRTSWTVPFVEPTTRQVVVAAVTPLFYPPGTMAGAASIVVPVHNLVENRLFSRNIPAATRMFLCQLRASPESDGARALIIAQDEQTEAAHRSWRAGLAPAWLASSDSRQFAALLEDVAAGDSDLQRMKFEGQDSLWAYSRANKGTFFVLVTPYRDIMAPVRAAETAVQKRVDALVAATHYGLILIVIVTIGLALVFSRTVTRPLWALEEGARRLGAGDFAARVEIRTRDEFGKMGAVFNQVGPQLKEMQAMRHSLAVAMEIQQRLLPRTAPHLPAIDIAGSSVYCDQTGGDYYDFIEVPGSEEGLLHVAVGDVSGHGIPAALLMTSTRAFLRQRSAISDRIDLIVSDTNEQLARDVGDSGQFVTLFYAEIDSDRRQLKWVRAGHEPAILYDAVADTFEELRGRGMPLGVFRSVAFEMQRRWLTAGQTIVVGTDGIWEARSDAGEMFGKERFKALVREHSGRPAAEIVSAVLDAVAGFHGSGRQEDDITLVVINVLEASRPPG